MCRTHLCGRFESREVACLSYLILLSLATFVLLFQLTAQTVHAARVRIEWSSNPGPDIAGYGMLWAVLSDRFVEGRYTLRNELCHRRS